MVWSPPLESDRTRSSSDDPPRVIVRTIRGMLWNSGKDEDKRTHLQGLRMLQNSKVFYIIYIGDEKKIKKKLKNIWIYQKVAVYLYSDKGNKQTNKIIRL